MNFRELLRSRNVPTAPEGHQHATEGWVQFDCPWCSPGSYRYRMGYNERNRFVNCWACGSHKLVDTLQKLLDRPRHEVRKYLDDLPTPILYDRLVETGKFTLPGKLKPLHRKHIAYLRGRGFDPKQLEKLWAIQATHIGKYPWRIYVPIILRGRTVSWTLRRIVDEGKRWHSASPAEEDINHKDLLYGQDYVRFAAIVHEGPTDVWRTGPGAVCTFGTGFSQAQLLRLSRIKKRIICFDSSPEAQRRASQLCDYLEVLPGETLQVQLDAEDPGSAPAKETKRLRALLTA